MLPDDQLSTSPVTSGFNYPVKTAMPDDVQQGWEWGGIALSDPSAGLFYQIWHCTLEIDEDTSIGYVYLEAPSVAKTLLFSDLGITAVDIAFDQNMHPFVAYKVLGQWKYWWWDPTIPGMAHTLLSNSRDLRCCLDDHRSVAVDNSDILLCYINNSNELCVRYQRERYTIEHVLETGIPENLVYVGMNLQYRVQFGFGYLYG